MIDCTEPGGEKTDDAMLPGEVTDPLGDLSLELLIIASAYGFNLSMS